MNIDAWLVRVSHVSQLGLFLLTTGALYFTVIPLYKTAALEETMARKESELATTELKLKKSTEALSKLENRIYTFNRNELIEGLVYISPYCSGLMQPPATRSPDHVLGDKIFKVDASECFKSHFTKSDAKNLLSQNDYSTLKQNIENIADTLATNQKNAAEEIKSLPARALSDAEFLNRFADKPNELDQLLKKISPEFIKRVDRTKLAIQSATAEIELKFVDSVSNEIFKLRDIEWPENPATAPTRMPQE